ncbi:MAG: hypothetical protein AB4372_06760 [Xenococcus sp. (in: cyanobacteria)]
MISLQIAQKNITLSLVKILPASLIAIFFLTLGNVPPTYSQIKPQVWGSIGSKEDDLSYAAGAKWAGFAIEVGTGKEGVTGGDFLSFFPIPFVSPYLGLGIYSGDDTLAYSGGLHLYPNGRLFIGAGYHSLRGINGKLGFKF